MERGIKFHCIWKKTNAFPMARVAKLNALRKDLYARGLIFADSKGVGHGNASLRIGKGFLITASGTGTRRTLTGKHFALVDRVDIPNNTVWCQGPAEASSESMTHHAVYRASPSTKAVIHVHAPAVWKKWIGKLPTTSRKARYGTPELAKEVLRLFRKGTVRKTKMFVLGGHKPGLIVFGRTVGEAEQVLLQYVH